MADLAFTDKEGFYSVVDVKTHRADTKFNMPNLTSVERLARFYESDQNIFALIMVKYAVEDTNVTVDEVIYSPIEFVDWNCLTVGALEAFLKFFFFVFSLEQQMDHNDMYKGLAIVG